MATGVVALFWRRFRLERSSSQIMSAIMAIPNMGPTTAPAIQALDALGLASDAKVGLVVEVLAPLDSGLDCALKSVLLASCCDGEGAGVTMDRDVFNEVEITFRYMDEAAQAGGPHMICE